MIKLMPAVAATLLAASTAATAAGGGWYVGAAAGRADIRDVCGPFEAAGLSQSCDEDASGWKVYAGYNFTANLGLEWGYVSLGEAKVVSPGTAGTATNESWAVPVAGVYHIPIGDRLDLFGKAGVYYFESETKTSGNLIGSVQAVDDDGIEAMVGVGAAFNVWRNLDLRIEWEHYNDAGPGDVDTLLGGLQWRF